MLDFVARDGRVIDVQTESTWNVFGQATAGRLEGQRLNRLDVHDSFWFDWAAFHPNTKVWEG